MMCITTLSLQTRPLIIYSNTLFCTNNRSPSRQSTICTSEEVRNILGGTNLHYNFEETQKNSKVLWSSFRTYLFYWLWSTWSQSWFWIFNVHLQQEKKKFLYPNFWCPTRHSINFKNIYKNFCTQKWVFSSLPPLLVIQEMQR